jgi:glycosyltransferase involved in cell wall biosynthesis
MIRDKKISLIIPCKNEEKIIYRTVKAVPEYVDEIIVVDNGSTDNTVQEAKRAGARVLLEGRKLNGIGYGFAHITGLKHATGDYVFAMDGDDTYPSIQIKEIVEKMEKDGLDFVSCSRLPLINPKAISKTRRLGIYILNIETFILYGKYLNDILTGMWGVRRTAIPLLELRMGDWNLSPEIKISALFNKDINFAEYHINHFEREKEPSKQSIWKTGFNHMFYILKRRFTQDSKLGGFIYWGLFNRQDKLVTSYRDGAIFAI